MNIPALNEITRQALGEEPKYAEDSDDRQYIILFPEDYQEHGVDMAGNVALLVNEENAREIKRLAEDALEGVQDE